MAPDPRHARDVLIPLIPLDPRARTPQNPWLTNLFHPLMIGGMFACIAIAVVNLVRLFFPSWNGTYLVLGCVLAALEANYSYRLIRSRRLHGSEVLQFRAAEIALLFILLKLSSYLGQSWASVWAEIQTWPQAPMAIVDPETTVTFVLALLSWWTSTQTTRDLERLGEPPELSRYYVPPRESLTNRLFWGGVFLLLLTGLHYVGIAQPPGLSRPALGGPTLNVLAYFLLELAMLGQIQFTSLRNQWQAQKVKIAGGLAARWVRYSLIFLVLAALAAFALPTGYTLGLLDVAGSALSLVAMMLTFVAQLFFFLFALLLWPLAYLLSLLFGTPPYRARPRLPSLLPSQPPAVAAGPGWLETLRSVFFWAIATGMVFYVVRNYLRDHPELLRGLTSLGLIKRLRRLWTAFRHWLAGVVETVDERLSRGRAVRRAGSGKPGEPFRLLRLGALPPRERILYFYLSILQRASRQGLGRRQTQTPYEYDANLGPHLPQAQQDMAALTQAFVEARYSTHTVGQEQARQARAWWQQVKAALRALRHQD